MTPLSRRDLLRAACFGGYGLAVDGRRFAADLATGGHGAPLRPMSVGTRVDPEPGDPNMRVIERTVDVLVAGGGMAGVCAAIAAARHGATATASHTLPDADPVHVLDGEVRDLPGEWTHRWGALMRDGGVWLELRWDRPPRISHVQITFDSGFRRELTLSLNRQIQRGPQPETVRDYTLTAETDTGRVTLATITGNFQRLRRHTFDPVVIRSLRLHVHATNGSERVRVFEVRVYA